MPEEKDDIGDQQEVRRDHMLAGVEEFMEASRLRNAQAEQQRLGTEESHDVIPSDGPQIEPPLDVGDLQKAVRCACLHLSNFSQVSSRTEMEKLADTDTTLQYIKRENSLPDTLDILSAPEYATMISYVPGDKDLYFHCVDHYAKAHAVTEGGSVTLTGPGIITMCAVDQVNNFLADRNAWLREHEQDGEENQSRNTQAVDTPVFLKVNSGQIDAAACIDDTLQHLQAGNAHGLIFQNSKDLAAFSHWYQSKLASQSGKTMREGYAHFRFPTLVLRGNPKEIYSAILEGGDASKAHAFFFDKPLSQPQAEQLRDARAAMMNKIPDGEDFLNPFNQGEGDKKKQLIHNIKIAIVNVQGGGRLEAAMIALASEKILDMNVHLRLVQTRQQIETWNPDALVLPGGWHFLQHVMQEHPETGINAILADVVKQNRVHLLGSCAGAILMRQPDTLVNKSIDCVPESALGILPYLVRNNARSGTHPTDFLIHGQQDDQWVGFPNALYVSAPEFLGVDADQLKIIAKSGNQTYGVLNNPDPNAPVYAATALHNQLPYVYWLHQIQENHEIQQIRMRHGDVEGKVQE